MEPSRRTVSPLLLAALCCSLFVVALIATPRAAAKADNGGGPIPAEIFCNSTEGRELKCGWASPDEQDKSTGGFCIWCGTIWQGEPPLSLPTNRSGHITYFQFAGHVISLGCQGPVVVRAVFKLTKFEPYYCDPSKKCTPVFLEYDNETVTRCELELPSDGGSEEERVLRSREANCTRCAPIVDGVPCASEVGVWYSDTLTTNAMGCAGVLAQGAYKPQIPYIVVQPRTEIEIAKFEVCGESPCFNASYEANKANNAK